MKAKSNWGLIGYGTIGQEIARQLSKPAVVQRTGLKDKPDFIIRTTGIMKADGKTPTGQKGLKYLKKLPKVVFVATPSDDSGIAYEYISWLLNRGVIVVTAEKTALADHFTELKERSNSFKHLGINATVGGGTRIISIAREYCYDIENVREIHLSLNGSLSAIFNLMASTGADLHDAVKKATKEGFVEPGASNPYDVIKNEAQSDVPKKVAIFFNAVGLAKKPIDWRDINVSLSNKQIDKAATDAKYYRFLVSAYKTNAHVRVRKNIIGGFAIKYEGWNILGGFQNISNSTLLKDLVKNRGPENGMAIGLGPKKSCEDGLYVAYGPGAGPKPTVNAMIDDYLSKVRN